MAEFKPTRIQQNDVPYDEATRYDVLVTSQNPGHRISDAMARSLILGLKTRYWFRPVREVINDDWVEVYGVCESTSSEVFTPRAFDHELSCFLEAVVRFGREASQLEYGPERMYFYIEFRGCLFREPLAVFKNFFEDLLHVRPCIAWRKHNGLDSRE